MTAQQQTRSPAVLPGADADADSLHWLLWRGDAKPELWRWRRFRWWTIDNFVDFSPAQMAEEGWRYWAPCEPPAVPVTVESAARNV